MKKKTYRNPWSWVPSLYFAQGIPYFAVNTISVLLFKKMGMSNADVALYTGWLYLPWVIKPFWSPFVDLLKTKRWWTVAMQCLMAVALAAVAFTLPHPSAASIATGEVSASLFSVCLAVFWVIGFASATHDIAADGYYLVALDSNEQSLFVGIRSTAYRLASMFGQGGLVVAAGYLETTMGDVPRAWMWTFYLISALFLCLALYHWVMLPFPKKDRTVRTEQGGRNVLKEFFGTFGSFFRKKQVGVAVLFMLLFRLPEAQLVKLIQPFLVDDRAKGGLGLSTSELGWVYGTIGIAGLLLGGIVGGVCAARGGLKRWLWPMSLSISLTCITFCYLAMVQPESMVVVSSCVFIEQLGYGFGFTAFMLYMMYFAEGEHTTSHYAICTAFMALGMMLPGMAAGWIQEQLGYVNFFWWVFGCNVATWGVTALIRVDADYGRKNVESGEGVKRK